MNEFRFCGRALETPELLESEKGSKYAHLFLRVEREYKNSDGTVDTDDFRITCFKSLAEEIEKNVKKGQTLGTVGNTATFEIADSSHLHFEIQKNDANLDPTLYIK